MGQRRRPHGDGGSRGGQRERRQRRGGRRRDGRQRGRSCGSERRRATPHTGSDRRPSSSSSLRPQPPTRADQQRLAQSQPPTHDWQLTHIARRQKGQQHNSQPRRRQQTRQRRRRGGGRRDWEGGGAGQREDRAGTEPAGRAARRAAGRDSGRSSDTHSRYQQSGNGTSRRQPTLTNISPAQLSSAQLSFNKRRPCTENRRIETV